MKLSVTQTIAVASRYIRCSSRSSSRSAKDFFIAPTAGIDSGHKVAELEHPWNATKARVGPGRDRAEELG